MEINVESVKIISDIGNETKIAIKDWIAIGVFAESDEYFFKIKELKLINII